jgi:Zn-dependent metalloprotease
MTIPAGRPVREPLHCILPPYILENLAKSPHEKVRRLAIENLAASAEARAVRATLSWAPALSAMTSPAGRKHRLVYDMQHRPPAPFSLPGVLVRSEGERASRDPAVNEAYRFSGYTYDFYWRNYGRNSLDHRGMSLISSVHVGEDYSNAFWNGEQMAYGDGDGVVFRRFTKALEVVGHELTHGVVTHTSNLEYRDEPGALNEHFADVLGILVKQWHRQEPVDRATWLIGDEILIATPTRRALRDLAHPGTAYRQDPDLGSDPQPAHMKKKYRGSADYGGVHVNSGIPNRAFYLAAMALGGTAWTRAGRIWYQALLQLTAQSDFRACARMTHQVAGGEFGATEQKAIAQAWKEVGIAV